MSDLFAALKDAPLTFARSPTQADTGGSVSTDRLRRPRPGPIQGLP